MDSGALSSHAGLLWNLLWIVPLLFVLVAYKLFLRLFGVVIVPEDSIGMVTKKFVIFGANKRMPSGSIIALLGEAGLQADTLAPGLHFGYWPWQYEIEMQKFFTVKEGYIGIVEARDGKPLADGHVLARKVECGSFQDARAFLTNGGERGPQIAIIPPGTYRIHMGLFTVVQEPVLEIPDGKVGIVTTRDGTPLAKGEIAGPEIAGHNAFQDGQTFITNGGFRGLQEQVMLAGRYYINPRFATVEPVDMTVVPIAHAGVVIAYVGKEGKDLSGASFQHGNLVAHGERGVWQDPLDPGKYPINMHTHKVECVPTANVVLNWATGKNEAHNLDKNLSTIKVRSSDGFTFNLDVSQIIHIPRNDAPKVISRFGSVANLVSQVLEPTIGNYFRNAAQKSDVIQFLTERSTRQEEARVAIKGALDEYNVGAVDTLIGDIVPPEDLMKTLTDRKLAQQQQVTYGTQKTAEDTRKELEQARAVADTQKNVVTAQRNVEIADFNAQSEVKKAEGDAQAKEINAKADAMVTSTVGKAQAERTLAIGSAEAEVIKQKTEAMQPDKFAMVEVAKALGASGMKWVPEIMVVGGEDGKGGTIADALLASLVSAQQKTNAAAPKAETPKPAHVAPAPAAAPPADKK
jgi:uncharacterized membrane protein YqiK